MAIDFTKEKYSSIFFGITSKMMENLTTCLGSFSVSLQEMIAAYGVFMIAPAFMGYIAKYLGIEGSSAYVRVSQLKKQAVDKLIENVDHSQVIDYL